MKLEMSAAILSRRSSALDGATVEHPVLALVADDPLHVVARLMVADVLDPFIVGARELFIPTGDRMLASVVGGNRANLVAIEHRQKLLQIDGAKFYVGVGIVKIDRQSYCKAVLAHHPGRGRRQQLHQSARVGN